MFKKSLLLLFILITAPSYTIDPLIKKDITKTLDRIYKDFESIFNESVDIFFDTLLTNPKAYTLAKNLEKILDIADSLSKKDTGEFNALLNEFFSKIAKKIKTFEKNNKWQILVKKYGKFGKIHHSLAASL